MDIEGGQGKAGGGLELGKVGKERLADSFIRRRHVDREAVKKSEDGKLGQQGELVPRELFRREVGDENGRKPGKLGQANAVLIVWYRNAEQEQRRCAAWRMGRTSGQAAHAAA